MPCHPYAGRRKRILKAAASDAVSSNGDRPSPPQQSTDGTARPAYLEASFPRKLLSHTKPPPVVPANPAREEKRRAEVERRRKAGVGPGGRVKEGEDQVIEYADFLVSSPKQPLAEQEGRRPAGPHWEDAKRVVMQVHSCHA
jgi:hypothetical protein